MRCSFWKGSLIAVSLAFVAFPGTEAAGEACAFGIPCGADEFCDFPLGLCGSSDPIGTCTTIPTTCPGEYDPVCGCDFVTYSNACWAAAAGVSVFYAGECDLPCGGIIGVPCGDGEFCKLPVGHCCCDFQGDCIAIPTDCPDTCNPVCGCDGVTYTNECEAEAASISLDHFGACDFPNDGLISGVVFDGSGEMSWTAEQAALSYNVYRKVITLPPPSDAGSCYLTDIIDTSTTIPGEPLSGEVWLLQLTGMFGDGEGPLGESSDCTPREPAEHCPV